MEAYYAAMRDAVEAHGGRVTQVMGDGVKAVFGVPRVAEDDAIRAVRAGVAMQDAFRALLDEQRGRVGATGLRVAVNTGEVVSDGETEIIGDPVNVAARLQEQGRDGDVVIGGSTQRIVASLVALELLGRFALKGRAEEVEAHRVVSLEPPAATRAAFVGRAAELGRLRAVHERATTKPETSLAVLLGSPGLGKTRLLEEFVARLPDDATVFSAHCDSSGGGTFAPIAAALRSGLGLVEAGDREALDAGIEAALPADDAERARIVAGVGALLSGSPASPEETFFVVRRLLAALATTKPVVLVIDDLQWAEPLLLDLVEHLVQWGSGVPLLVLVGARPELRDLRSSLVTPGGFVTDVITLAGLDAGAAMQLAAGVIGAVDLPAALAGKLLASSEGNPLFVAELVKMLVQEGVLEQRGERWVASTALADLEMPPTIQALLAARIERLAPEERTVLERAAVVGRSFSRAAVAALLRETSDLDARLEALRRSELIESDASWFLGEPRLRFHHVLIRDAAYRRVLKGTRAELHARLAGWIEAQVGDAAEHDETIGRHLEQAHQHLRELGPLDEEGVALGERAARRLAPAGRRALSQDDVALAAGLLGRAVDCLPGDAPDRADLVLDWCEAVLSAGDVATAATAIEALERLREGSPRLRAWHTCFAGQLTTLTDPEGLQSTAPKVAAAAQELARLEDAAGEAKGHFVHAQTLARLGQVGACEAALDQALAAARRVDDRRRANAVLTGAPRAALWGPSPVTRASGRCLDVVRVLRITQGAPAVEAVALSCQGVLEALRGRTDAAKRMIASAREMVEELGIAHRLHEADVFAGRVALLEGDAATAERLLRGAYDGLRTLGLGIDAAQAAALLARALLAEGRADEADSISRESEALAGDDLQAAIAWRGARAEALAQRGAHEEAVAMAKAGVEIAAATDALLDHADARMALAAALRAAGRRDEAEAEERRARDLWQAKGATLLVERAGAASDASSPAAAGAPNPLRRITPNLALETFTRSSRVIASGDRAGLEAVMHPDHEEIHHPTGSRYGRDDAIRSAERLFQSSDVRYRVEPLATLGDRLLLAIRHIGASGTGGGRFDVGPYEGEFPVVFEVDAEGRLARTEAFPANRLGDAVACLYERHAALEPEGAERARADERARSLGALTGHFDIDRVVGAMDPEVDVADHRSVVNIGRTHGAEQVRSAARAMLDLTDGFDWHVRDVLAASDRALLVHQGTTGRQKAGGGDFERSILELWLVGDSGKVVRWERFEPEEQARALERFDALTGRAAAPTRRVRPNAASALAARFEATFMARDDAGLAALWSDDLLVVDHPTGRRYGLEGHLDSLRRFARAENPTLRVEPIATLGDSLVLAYRPLAAVGTTGSRVDVAEWERVEHVVFESGEDERFGRVEIFAASRLGDAITCLYERFGESLPPGAEREAALSISRGNFFSRIDLATFEANIAPDIAFVDHRRLGFEPTHGRAAFLALVRSLQEASPDSEQSAEQVLGAEPNALLLRMTNTGTDQVSGGRFERHFIRLFLAGAEGMERIEQFDVEVEREALARFGELTGGAAGTPSSDRFENASTRANAGWVRCFASADWAGIEASIAPGFVFDDRRSLRHLTLRGPDFLTQFRGLFDVPGSRFESALVATRGERLSLHRHRFTGQTESGGDVDFGWHLALCEVDEQGRFVACIPFDLDDEAAAWAELDAHFVANEGALHPEAWGWYTAFRRAFDARDWDAMIELTADEQVARNHRTVGWGTLRGRGAWVGPVRELIAMAEDTQQRVDHLRICPRGSLMHATWVGTREGGTFETPQLIVTEVDESGRQTALDLFGPESSDAAWRRFEEIASPHAPTHRFQNAAARVNDRLVAAWRASDWDAFAACVAPTGRFIDRRRMFRVELSPEQFAASARQLGEMESAQLHSEILATRGQRLALNRLHIEVSGGDVGASDVVHLNVVETDEHGSNLAQVRFDPDDLEAATAELDARYAAGEGGVLWRVNHDLFAAAFRRDREACLAALAPGFFVVDHRRLGFGRTIDTPDAFFRSQEALVELAPDIRYRFDHFETRGSAYLCHTTQIGTRDGGAFERPLVYTGRADAQGRLTHFDAYDPDRVEEAQARFEALASEGGRLESPFANAASHVLDRLMGIWRRRDWDAFTAILSADFHCSDRRSLVRLEMDAPEFIAFTRQIGDQGTGVDAELQATRGERLALVQMVSHFSDEAFGPSELEVLLLLEVNEGEEIQSIVRFDRDDLDAAYREIEVRFLDGEGAGFGRYLLDFGPAYERRDWDAIAESFAPGFVAHDHRLAGFGTLRGVEDFLAGQRAMVELAPDARVRAHHIRQSGRVRIAENAWTGTRDGGPFEIPLLSVLEVNDEGRNVRMDLFDGDRYEEAFRCFEERARAAGARLSNPLDLPPNLATRAADASGDLAGRRELVAPDFRFEDRQKHAQVVGDVETWIESGRYVQEIGRMERVLTATRGERIAIYETELQGPPEGPHFSLHHLCLYETDAQGQLCRFVLFDPDQRAAAFGEAEVRFEAGEAATLGAAHRPILALNDALDTRDWEGFANVLAPDAVVRDRRRLGLGRLDPERWIECLRALTELAPDLTVVTPRVLAWNERGRVAVATSSGHGPEGGAFENLFLSVILVEGECVRSYEAFDLEDVDRALARFEELCGG
jgi:tetratricopeptide (TPR) repeat protein